MAAWVEVTVRNDDNESATGHWDREHSSDPEDDSTEEDMVAVALAEAVKMYCANGFGMSWVDVMLNAVRYMEDTTGKRFPERLPWRVS